MYDTPRYRTFTRGARARRASSYSAAGTRSRAATVAKRRQTNLPVRRALAKPTRTTARTVTRRKNTNAIVTLARQVRTLQMQHYGDIQYTRQVLCKNDGGKDITGNGAFLNTAPYMFELLNFYNQARVYKGDMDASFNPTYTQEHRWLVLSEAGATGAGKPYAFDVTNDAVSHNQYMPLTAFYQWHVKFTDVEKAKDKVVRLTVFKLKTTADNAKVKTLLPDYLGQYANMAMEDPSDRNKFSPVYHKVLYQRSYHLKNTGDVTKDIERDFTMKWSFSRQDGLVRLDTDQIEGTPSSSTQEYCAQHFRHLIRPQDQIYVLLSTSNGDQNCRAEISCMRTLRWRDNEGVISV